MDDLAAIAAEDDDADDAFAASFARATSAPAASEADAGTRPATRGDRPSGGSEADRLEAAARLAELRSRWEFAEVLAFLTAFRRELRAGARRANQALGFRETHWAAAAPTAAELERALADPEGTLAFPESSGFPAEAPLVSRAPPSRRDDGGDGVAPSSPSPPAAETVIARRRARRGATLARTHLSLLFGLEPETRVSDKPPAGGWSKRWPEWTARVVGERVAELFGARERRAPFDRSAFETVVEADAPGSETPRASSAGGGLEKKPARRRLVVRRSAAEAYAAVTPTRRVRALWGLCEARLACDDIREKLAPGGSETRARFRGATALAAADAESRASPGALWYVGRHEDDRLDDASGPRDGDDGDDSDAALDVVCGVARAFRASPPRWDVVAEPLAEKRLGDAPEPRGLETARARSDPGDGGVPIPGSPGPPGPPGPPGSPGSPRSRPRGSEDDAASGERAVSPARASGDESSSPGKEALPVSPNPALSRGALEYAERAIWADAASAKADAAARWAFVLEEPRDPGRAGSSSGVDGSESSEEDDLSDLDSPSPRRRRRKATRAGKKPARGARRETVEARFARRARCDVSDVICSLASEGKWLETRERAKKRAAASRKAAENAVGSDEPAKVRGDSKKTRRRGGRDVPPYHRFAASFVSVPPLGEGHPDAMVRLDDIPCAWCGDASGESAFVLCDGCPNGGHLACLGLRGVPKNKWFCAVCADGGEGADAPRTRVVRRLAHPRFVASAARDGNRPRAPREGAWETVAEERALWESPAATDRFDARWRGATSTIKTHASFARDAFERASARRREATRHAAAAARVERAALDARRAERLARRDDDVSCDDDDEDDDWDGDDTGDDTDRSEGARYARPLVSESDAGELGALHSGGDGTRTGATARRRDSGDSGDSDDSGDFLRRGRTMSSIRRGRPGPTLAILTWTDEKAHEQMPRLCARCGDACFPDADRSSNRPRGSAFAKCAFCPAEGHRACVFGDALDACAVCARKTSRSRDGPDPRPAVRAPPSPVARRAFPRRVPTRVRRALESDVDDAWRFE